MAPLYKPDVDTLNELKKQALAAVPNAIEWRKKFLGNLATILREDPKRYRAYGPYWWGLKKALVAEGITEFGETVDAEWLAQTDYGDATRNILAAWLYADSYSEPNGLMYSHDHPVAFSPDAQGEVEQVDGEFDVLQYTLIDEEVEVLALERS